MQNNIGKPWNNTLASPVREIKSNFGKNAHFIAKETHRLHNSVTELDIVLFSMVHHTAPADNRA